MTAITPSTFIRPADSDMPSHMHARPMLTTVRKDDSVSPVVYHFEGYARDGEPVRLSLPRPLCVQFGTELDLPHVWDVTVKDRQTMDEPGGSMWGFAVDLRTPEGRAVMEALGHGSRVQPPPTA